MLNAARNAASVRRPASSSSNFSSLLRAFAMAQSDPKLGLQDEFNTLFGRFWGAWLSAELTIDYTIYRLLRISKQQAHLMLAGMEVGRKMRLLESLLKRSTLRRKAEILGYLHVLQNDALRNVFAHSLLWSDEHTVTFLNRHFGQKYAAQEYKFTLIRFRMHVGDVLKNGGKFYEALEIDYDDLQSFGHAALRASRSSSKSPKPPKSRA